MSLHNWRLFWLIVAMGGGICATIGTFAMHVVNGKIDALKSRRAAKSGVLVPRQAEARQSTTDSGAVSDNIPLLYFGKSNACIDLTANPDSPILDVFGMKLFVRSNNGKIDVSFDIVDKDSKMVASLRNNEWQVNPNSAFDRNYTEDALEIIGANGEVAFQIELVPEGARVQMKVYGADGECMGIWAAKDEDGELGGIMHAAYTPEDIARIPAICPMFKYPSELHFGEFADAVEIPTVPLDAVDVRDIGLVTKGEELMIQEDAANEPFDISTLSSNERTKLMDEFPLGFVLLTTIPGEFVADFPDNPPYRADADWQNAFVRPTGNGRELELIIPDFSFATAELTINPCELTYTMQSVRERLQRPLGQRQNMANMFVKVVNCHPLKPVCAVGFKFDRRLPD